MTVPFVASANQIESDDNTLEVVSRNKAKVHLNNFWSERLDIAHTVAVFDEALSDDDQEISRGYGRGEVQRFSTKDGEELVLRVYRRGGLVRHLMSTTFLIHRGELRSLCEYKILSHLRGKNILVPEPVAVVVRMGNCGLSYQTAIVMRAIPGGRNLLEFARSFGDSAQDIEVFADGCRQAGVLAQKILANGIFHPDLHLGNAIIDDRGDVWLLDFDKALRFVPTPYANGFASKTAARWLRSVEKHLHNSSDMQQIASSEFLRGFSRS